MRTYFINEYTGERFDTADECEVSEKVYLEKRKAEEDSKKELDEAWEKVENAWKEYMDLVSAKTTVKVKVRESSLDDLLKNFFLS